MPQKTLYISDLDGTLLTKEQTLSQYTVDTINALIDSGVMFSYATARGYVTASKVTANLCPKIPVIVQNGTFTVQHRDGKKLVSNTFSRSEAEYIYRILTTNGIYPTVYSFIDEKERFSYRPDRLSTGMKCFLNTRRNDPRENIVTDSEPLIGDVYYFACIDEKDRLNKTYEILKNEFLCICSDDIYFDAHWLEIMHPRSGKANAVQSLKKMLGCDRLVCFGDGKNDISMFEIADECYAVKNADEELKSIATAVIDSNDEDGVAKWLKRHAISVSNI